MQDAGTDSGITLKTSDKIIGSVLILVALAALVGVGLYVVPIITAAITNVIVLAGVLVVAALLGLVLLDKNTWVNTYYAWKNVSRKIRRAIIREDPIGVLDTVIQRREAQMADIDTSLSSAKAAQQRQSNTIRDMESKAAKEMKLAQAAQQQGQSDAQIAVYAAKSQRWADAADELKPLAKALGDMQEKLQQAREVVAAKLEDIKGQREVLAVKLDAMKHGRETVRSFKRFLGANPDLAMHQMTVEEIERQTTEDEAEIQQFLRVVNPMMEQQQLEQESERIKALEKMQKFIAAPSAVPQITGVATGEPVPVSRKESR